MRPMTRFLLSVLYRVGFFVFSYWVGNTGGCSRGPSWLVKRNVSKKKGVKWCVGPGVVQIYGLSSIIPTGTPKDKDEVDKREVCECDG